MEIIRSWKLLDLILSNSYLETWELKFHENILNAFAEIAWCTHILQKIVEKSKIYYGRYFNRYAERRVINLSICVLTTSDLGVGIKNTPSPPSPNNGHGWESRVFS